MGETKELNLLELAQEEKWYIVDLLLNSISLFGLDVNRSDEDENGIIHILAEKNPLLLEKALEKAVKLDVNKKNKEGKTALHISVENGNLQAVRALVQIKADQNLKDCLGETPIFKSIVEGGEEIFCHLMKSGSFILTTNNDGCNLLHLTAQSDKFIKLSQLLIKQNLRATRTNNFQLTPLHVAISKGSCDTAKLLIENGATIDLHVVVHKKQVEIIKVLIKHGSKIDSTNTYGEGSLHIAVQNESLDVLAILLEAGAFVNLPDEDGYTPLHLASKIPNFEFANLLLLNGASINLGNFNGDLPIHIAASVGNLEVLKLLAENVDLNLQNKDGYTPLHLAWENGHSQVVDYLITRGANFNLVNKFNNKPCIKFNILNGRIRRNTVSHC